MVNGVKAALAVRLNLGMTHLGVKTAFLNGYLEEEVYMRQPEGFVKENESQKVCKLKWAIYGLKQASRSWNKRIDEFLVKLGYKKSILEPCLYVKKSNDLMTVVALYVDDSFIYSNDDDNVMFLKNSLGSEFRIKDLGEAKRCLGM